jgi:acetyl-CoA acetyltransferase
VSTNAERPPAVAVAGIGETGPVAEDPRSIPEMVLAAVDGALADAGLGHDDIDAVVTASIDLFDGLTASNIAVTEVVGAVMKPECRISADGLAALVQAACQIRAGAYPTVLVVAHAKASMAPNDALTEWAMDPIHMQPLAASFLVCAGLQARLLAFSDAGAEERWAALAARRRGTATAAEILASDPVAAPLRQGMCAQLGDGACAVVLRAAGEDADGPILCGVGHDLEPHALGDRDLTRWTGLARALRRARCMAGLAPDAGFDLAEPSCLYPHEEELFLAAADVGEGAEISPGGGLMAGCVPIVGGLSRLTAAVRWLRRAENRGKRALAHGAWGPAGQGQAVAILEGGHP